MRRLMRYTAGAVVLPALLLAGCMGDGETPVEDEGRLGRNGEAASAAEAIAVLQPTEGNEAQGIVEFRRVEDGVLVTAEVSGLTPGLHGFHIHEFGDCSAPDATSAGGHFNPTDRPHGAPTDEERHVGDLGNIEIGPDGTGKLTWEDPVILLEGEHSIIGKAVVIHADPDDLVSQPTGNAGARLACGVIQPVD